MTMSAEAPIIDDDLRTWAQDAVGVPITAADPLGSGASRRTWALAFADATRLVLREDTGDGPAAGTPLTLTREAAVYHALDATDIPVPQLVAAHPAGRALLLSHADGTDDLRGASAGERAAASHDYLRWLARLHRLDMSTLDLGPLRIPPGASAYRTEIDLWRAIHDTRTGATPTPAAAVALDWLRDHPVPDPGAPSLCHGDAGPGNFLHDRGRITALLDWEFAHLGDPHDDLAWIAVRNQLLGRPFDLAAAWAAWHDEAATPIDTIRLEHYRALVLTRMLVSCDATLACQGHDAPGARVQAVLRPWLAVATLEALTRAGCPTVDVDDVVDTARTQFAAATASHILGDPAHLDDLGAHA